MDWRQPKSWKDWIQVAVAALGRCEVCEVCDLGGFVNSLCGWTASIEGGRHKQREPMQRRFLCFVRRAMVGQVPQVG